MQEMPPHEPSPRDVWNNGERMMAGDGGGGGVFAAAMSVAAGTTAAAAVSSLSGGRRPPASPSSTAAGLSRNGSGRSFSSSVALSESSASLAPSTASTTTIGTDENAASPFAGPSPSHRGPLMDDNDDDNCCVQVVVRVRPPLASEGQEQCLSILNETSIRVGVANASSGLHHHHHHHHHHRLHRYTFDGVFGSTASTAYIFDQKVQSLVHACIKGYNATILAYGQTGSGKTHTILGPSYDWWGTTSSGMEEDYGVLPRAVQALFSTLEHEQQMTLLSDNQKSRITLGGGGGGSGGDGALENSAKTFEPIRECTVKLQFLELYGEEIRDLLSPRSANGGKKLTVRDNGVDEEPEVPGATQTTISSVEEAAYCVRQGCLRRVTAATAMNASSSRSHALLSVCVEQVRQEAPNMPPSTTRSKFHFVDLAGSERQKRTQAVGQRLKEGIDINKGLLVLGNVISALGGEKSSSNNNSVDGESPTSQQQQQPVFVPYRDSKLTRLLRGSLGGNHKTLMIACVSPAPVNLEESLNCLRYANRAKNIQNKAVVNVDAATKLVAELKERVGLLASDLLTHLDDDHNNEENGHRGNKRKKLSFTKEALQAMASGHHDAGSSSSKNLTPGRSSSNSASIMDANGIMTTPKRRNYGESPSTATGRPPPPLPDTVAGAEKLRQVEAELYQTQQRLAESQKHHDKAEEELFVIKAQKHVFELQLSLLEQDKKGGDNDAILLSSGELLATTTQGGNGVAPPQQDILQQAFMQKAVTYEREIAQLKAALEKAEAKNQFLSSMDSDAGLNATTIEQAQRDLEQDRARLAVLRQQHEAASPDHHGNNLLRSADSDVSLATSAEVAAAAAAEEAAEQQAEQVQMQALKKYLVQGGLDEEEDESSSHPAVMQGSADDEEEGAAAIGNDKENPSASLEESQAHAALIHQQLAVSRQQERLLKADLMELTRSIAAKEDLIEQLKLSQEKYATMRQFYEEKLRQMEITLKEKEEERDKLVRQINSSKTGDVFNQQLKDRLKEKESHIADLRRKQKQLRDLTAVSSRNEVEIARLQSDVKAMKRKKVDLQKQLGAERKTHANELRKLQKVAMQKERELNKYKLISNQREMQAQRANQVAKARLDEIGALRAKYKESEKKLRLKSVKRGVMAKAGLDPVLVGRRAGSLSNHRGDKRAAPNAGQSTQQRKGQDSAGPTQERPSERQQQVDPDILRDLFDQKVAEVVRKEALVNKLAEEWEGHFELCCKKNDLSSGADDDATDETLQSLSIQIQYKEDRIRQLAQRLARQRAVGNEQSDNSGPDTGKQDNESFLFDSEISKLCKAAPPEAAQKTLIKVLFGMVVRERKRIAALARTASSLDEKLQSAEKTAEASETALRSYMDEQRLQVAAMSQSQQKQLLSLMEMVKEDSGVSLDPADLAEMDGSNHTADTKLLVLANERISLLENQVQDLESEAALASFKQNKIEELTTTLETSGKENEELSKEVGLLKTALRQIRDTLNRSDDSEGDSEVLQLVSDALHPAPVRKRHRPVPQSASASPSTPRIKTHYELMHTSESEDDVDDDEEMPEWASSIMEELAFIAEGKVPPSLADSPEFNKDLSHLEKNSVFDRLNDPSNFTGIQKQARAKGGKKRIQVERRVKTKDAPDRLDKGIMSGIAEGGPKPTAKITPTGGDRAKPENVDTPAPSVSKEHKSVFERLVSPSQATGTQKQKLAERSKHEEDTHRVSGNESERASRILDDLLDSDCSERGALTSASDYIDQARNAALDYTEQDVFERLTRTTTMSYAVKHMSSHPEQSASQETGRSGQTSVPSSTSMDDLLSQVLDDSESEDVSGRDYTSQDVFERLQKTTTEAYAKKMNKVK